MKKSGDTIKVVNGFEIRVNEEELQGLIFYLLSKYAVKRIIWECLVEPLPVSNIKAVIKTNRLDDNIAYLPGSFNEYLNSLGVKTKKHSKYYINRLNREFSSVDYVFKRGTDITDEEFKKLCFYSANRMANKDMIYSATKADEL